MRKFLVTYSQNNEWMHIITADIGEIDYLCKLFVNGHIDELIMGQYKTEDKEDE